MRIIPIASGKGGVGKSMVAANLAVAFAQAGKRVILADLDLGASNLHLVIGHQAPQLGIGTFLSDTRSDFSKVVADTDIPNLRFIPGDTEIPGTANLKPSQRKALVKRLLALDADILILDLGAGTHQSILEFFLLSGQGIIVSAPTVTATLNAYVFLKNTIFRLMYTAFLKDTKAYNYLEKLRKEGSGLQRLYLPKMLQDIKKIDTKSYNKFKTNVDRIHPRLIMNMVQDPKDADVAAKIRRSCEVYLDLKIEHLGIIYRDALQDTSLAARLPITIYKPQSVLSQAIFRIADKILQSDEDNFTLTDEEINDTFQEAAVEAETDFENKMEYVEELMHSGALSQGDLIETVKTQQIEISKLKKESNFLKYTLSRAIREGFKP
ncbi:ATP-binding protein [Treponema primitia ZAS-2]|uniref:ATP-binding protein n=1 Tax=Treponema primitia (strain ATCC BAA-887 / DSM 12427 / ZAS-2) TaxID=545694 RepID=F5YPL6_TREPZ|nr:P-loop NTPase [Treponema primitia]AEF86468.1 ATP-binding protein [Treponema primitia ZAS-2]